MTCSSRYLFLILRLVVFTVLKNSSKSLNKIKSLETLQGFAGMLHSFHIAPRTKQHFYVHRFFASFCVRFCDNVLKFFSSHSYIFSVSFCCLFSLPSFFSLFFTGAKYRTLTICLLAVFIVC